MKIWTHRYQLQPREIKLKAREGALLKIEWVPGQIGYSDLHPWPEFGEPTLDEHLERLMQLNFTPLVDVSLEFNYTDREFRMLKRNAFLGLVLPRAHRLVFDLATLDQAQLKDWAEQGFTHIKVKMGRDLPSETAALVEYAYATRLLWRVDFNGRLSSSEFTKWWESLDSTVRERIDFVEDPTSSGELKLSGPWANDWNVQKSAQIRILKPARDPSEDTGHYSRVIFTHSLDHSLGQACSLWTAARYYMRHPKRAEVCGLGGTNFFIDDAFAKGWKCLGPRLKPTGGLGFGFDEILTSLRWERAL